MGFGGWLLMGLFWVLLLGAILWTVLTLMPHSVDRNPTGDVTPEQILDRRFASGDLDVDTCRAQRDALTAARGNRR